MPKKAVRNTPDSFFKGLGLFSLLPDAAPLGDPLGVEVDFVVQPVQGGLHIRHAGGQLLPLADQQGPAGLQGLVWQDSSP